MTAATRLIAMFGLVAAALAGCTNSLGQPINAFGHTSSNEAERWKCDNPPACTCRTMTTTYYGPYLWGDVPETVCRDSDAAWQAWFDRPPAYPGFDAAKTP